MTEVTRMRWHAFQDSSAVTDRIGWIPQISPGNWRRRLTRVHARVTQRLYSRYHSADSTVLAK